MKKALDLLQKVENGLIIIAFTVMVTAAFAQVVNRNIFKLGIGWFEELAIYCMIWMTLLGTELGLRDGTQMSVTAVVDRFKGKAKKLLHIVSKALVVIFTTMITYSAVGMVLKQLETGQTTPGLKISMAIPYSALLVGFGIMAVVQAVTLVIMIVQFGKQEQVLKEGGGEQ